MSYLKNLESEKRWWERRIAQAELQRAEAICKLSIFYKELEETEKLIDEELQWEKEHGSK